MRINENFAGLKESYLFAEVAKRVNEFKAANPAAKVIRLGIGDVTLPLPKAVTEAMSAAALELGAAETFHGYNDWGYDFLKDAIIRRYAEKGVAVKPSELFVSDGAKSDIGNIVDIFDRDNAVLIPDPVYPVYVDTNIMSGRKVVFADGTEDNGFLPPPGKNAAADIIYLCSPNNPTGAVFDKSGLKAWVDYANERGAVILFDAAYEAFVRDKNLPTSIFEIDGAQNCAIEFCSFSKTAGFTGVRCGYCVIPEKLERGGVKLNKLWTRRQSTKFNGVSYITQRGAAAALSPEGVKACGENISYYLDNAKIIAGTLGKLGVWFTGGENSPYIWLKCPGGAGSWEFFDKLLNEANVVGTPGAGFGRNGEKFFRLTAFGARGDVEEAMGRFERLM